MDPLPLSVYALAGDKKPSVPDAFLFQFLHPDLKKALRALPGDEVSIVNRREKDLRHDIVQYIEHKVDELKQCAEEVLRSFNSTEASRAKAGQASSINSEDATTPTSEGSNISMNEVKLLIKQPRKSSLVKHSDTDSDTSSRKSSKRVMFAEDDSLVQSQVIDSSDDEASDTEDDDELKNDELKNDEFTEETNGTLLNQELYLEPEEIQKELNSLTMTDIVPEVDFTNMRSTGEGEADENNDEHAHEIFEFDETMADSELLEQNSQDPSAAISIAEEDFKKVDDKVRDNLLSPSLGESLPNQTHFSLPRVAGSFRPRPNRKYVMDEIEEEIGTEFSTRQFFDSNQYTSNYASSLPINIVAPTEAERRNPLLQALRVQHGSQMSSNNIESRATELAQSTLSREIKQNPLSNDEDEEIQEALDPHIPDQDEDLAQTTDVTATTAAAFGSFLNRGTPNPARMSFTERMRWERESANRA